MKEAIYFNPLTSQTISGHVSTEALEDRRIRYGWEAIEEHIVSEDDLFVIEGGLLVKKNRTVERAKRQQARRAKQEAAANKIKNKLKLNDADIDDLKTFLKGA